MKLGLHIAATTWEGGARRLGQTLAEIVEAAEAAGFDAIDVADHLWLHPIMGGPQARHV
jgi:alkanesulfonate monooxygenase SsuD/methylene tetrahydromethanopterin reductase-like flavin-dependent oxidoreductase (luciferase family)